MEAAVRAVLHAAAAQAVLHGLARYPARARAAAADRLLQPAALRQDRAAQARPRAAPGPRVVGHHVPAARELNAPPAAATVGRGKAMREI